MGTQSNCPKMNLQPAKDLVRAFYADFGKCKPDAMEETMKKYCHADYSWRGMYPFNEFSSVSAVCEQFWKPLRHALSNLQHRPDIFMARINVEAKDDSVWVVSMGNLMGSTTKLGCTYPQPERWHSCGTANSTK